MYWVQHINSIEQLAWEPCHNFTVLQRCSTSVEGHPSCRMQVSSALQQGKEDDLLLVEIDTQHHDSHHKTVIVGRLSFVQCEKCSNFCWVPFDNSFEIRVLWKQGNRSADAPFACPGNLSVSIWPLSWRSCPACPSWWWAPIVLSHNCSAQPSSRRWDQKPRCQPRICTPNVLLQKTICSILVLLELMLLFVHGISSWPLLLLLYHKWPYSVPACLWSDCQLLSGVQFVCCRNRWSFHRGTMTAAHMA